MMKSKPFETAYEKRVKNNIRILMITVWTSVLAMIGGAGLAELTGDMNKYAPIFVLLGFAIHIVFWSVYYPISIKKMRIERIQSAQFYRTLSQENIYTKFDAFVVVGGKRKRLKKPVTIDKIGLRSDEIEIVWKDCKADLQVNSFGGQNFYFLQVISNKDKTVVDFPLSPKDFYLFKNFSGLEIDRPSEVENWIRQKAKIDINPNKKKNIPEGAQVFKSRFWLVFSLAMVGVAICTIPIAYALSFLGDWLITLALFVFVPAVMPLWYKLPRGTTYISKDKVFSYNLDEIFSFDLATAEIKYSKMTITISNGTFSVMIYKTKRAKNLIEQAKTSA